MAESDVKILGGWSSPFVMRPLIAFNIKSVEYELLQEKFRPKSDLLLKSNPLYKKVPVLIHGDKPICESLLIVQYIDEVWTSGPSILPSDPYDRAIARFWAAYIDDKWFTPLTVIAKGTGDKAEAAKQVSVVSEVLEEAFKTLSKGKDFFGGERIGYVDIALGCFLAWLKVSEKIVGLKILDEEKTPCLVGWAERFCADDAVKEVMPETERLLEFAKMLQTKSAAPPPPTTT